MEYYIIYQDNRITDYPEPLKGAEVFRKETVQKWVEENDCETPIQLYIKEKSQNIFIDFIERPVSLVKDSLKKVLEECQGGVFYKPVVLADNRHSDMELYWLIVPQKVSCLSSSSEFNKNSTEKRLVIDENKAEDFRIFKIDGILEDYIIIDRYVAEYILMNPLIGLKLRKIDNNKTAKRLL